MTYGDTLIVVNDSEHLRSLIGENSLKIDFSKNTLILGQVTSSYSGTEIVTDYLEKCNDKIVLQYRVIIADYGDGYEIITPRGFWGLYPKMMQPIEFITDYVYPQSK